MLTTNTTQTSDNSDQAATKFKLFAIMLVAFVDYLGIGLVYPLFAVLLFDPNQTFMHETATPAFRGAMLGILIGLTPIAQFFAAPLLGAFSDHKGRKIALVIGIATGLIGYCMAIIGVWTSSLLLLFLYRLLVGVSDATYGVAQAALADFSTEENKGRRFALLTGCQGFGFTIGPFLGGKLSDATLSPWFSYSLPFIVAGTLCLLNLLLILWKFPEAKKVVSERAFNLFGHLNSLAMVKHYKNLYWIFAAGFVFMFGWTFFGEFSPLLLRDRFNFSLGDIGNFYAYNGGWYAVSASFITGLLIKRFSNEKLVVTASIGCGLCMLAFTQISASSVIWFVLPLMMMTLAVIFPTSTMLVSDNTDKEHQGEAMGIFNAFQAAAMGICPLVAGAAVGTYPALTAWGGAVTMGLASIAFWLGCKVLLPKPVQAQSIG